MQVVAGSVAGGRPGRALSLVGQRTASGWSLFAPCNRRCGQAEVFEQSRTHREVTACLLEPETAVSEASGWDAPPPALVLAYNYTGATDEDQAAATRLQALFRGRRGRAAARQKLVDQLNAEWDEEHGGDSPMKPGQRVRVLGGTSAGRAGKVLEWVQSKGRYLVELDSGDQRRFLPAKLQALPDTDESKAAQKQPGAAAAAAVAAAVSRPPAPTPEAATPEVLLVQQQLMNPNLTHDVANSYFDKLDEVEWVCLSASQRAHKRSEVIEAAEKRHEDFKARRRERRERQNKSRWWKEMTCDVDDDDGGHEGEEDVNVGLWDNHAVQRLDTLRSQAMRNIRSGKPSCRSLHQRFAARPDDTIAHPATHQTPAAAPVLRLRSQSAAVPLRALAVEEAGHRHAEIR